MTMGVVVIKIRPEARYTQPGLPLGIASLRQTTDSIFTPRYHWELLAWWRRVHSVIYYNVLFLEAGSKSPTRVTNDKQ
jgi:hypothetical protein